MALEFINPRNSVINKETIGTLVFSADVERKSGVVSRATNGTVTENDVHLANFSLEENGYFNLNFPVFTQEKMVAVCAAIPSFINSIMIAE